MPPADDTNMRGDRPTRNLFGIPIQALTIDKTVSIVDEMIELREQLLIGVVNAAKIVNMRRDKSLDRAVRSADVILADGIGVVWAARILRQPLPERVPGIDLMMRMFQHGHQRGYRVYCLGATSEVLDVIAERIASDYPGVNLVGSHHGYFLADEETAVVAEIREAHPDILFVAMSSPKKEEFLARRVGEMGVPVCHGVGGAFDVMAGKVKRAPWLWQKLGMEWLYRVVQEPRRMWRRYLITNTLFGCMLVSELIGQLFTGTSKRT